MTMLTRRQLLYSIALLGVGARSWPAMPSKAGASQAAGGRIRVRSLNHFGLAVSDPKRSVDF